MPTYDYRCDRCGEFDRIRSLSARNDPIDCPDCGGVADRIIASAPALAVMDDATRIGQQTNERARHEPRRMGEPSRLRHMAGCGCCSPGGKRGTTRTAPNGLKALAGRRPWMISH